MKISAIIVTFNPGSKIKDTIDKLNNQVEKIFIIDNNSNKKEKVIELNKYKKVEVIYNNKNIGLGAAQNIGIKKSIDENFEWILFLDDDSEIEDDFIEKLKKGYYSYKDKDKLGILAPNILFRNLEKKVAYPIKSKFFIKRINFNGQKYIDDVMFVISSGSLIKIDMIKKIDSFKEHFFVDHIDVEYCLRVNSNNYKIRVVKDAKLYQKVGNTSHKKVLGIRVYPTNHSPERQYTKYRNAIWTWKEYFLKEPQYVIYDILLMTNHMLRVVCFENKKYENLKNIFKGIVKGLIK
ncbi:MAG: glycosyltransferase family 2 protein [Cetobacterium sp.]